MDRWLAADMEVPESPGFVEYLRGIEIRFLQERDVGLDLYSAGWLGVATAGVAVASLTIFALALFQIIPKRRHVLFLLGFLAVAAVGAGLGATWMSHRAVETGQSKLFRELAGQVPHTLGQEAAVVALPLLVGAATALANVGGCLYLAIFWSGDLLPRRRNAEE